MSERAIVCVDDEAIQLLALKREIQRAFGQRYIVETALDAEQALATLDSLADDGVEIFMIITDWLMPGIRGDELILSARAKFPGLRSILMTGQVDEEAKRRCVEAGGVIKILGKPWKKEELFAAIEGADAEERTRMADGE
jgi:CheY-like chemotaxis protein